MKRSELRKIIREEVQRLTENSIKNIIDGRKLERMLNQATGMDGGVEWAYDQYEYSVGGEMERQLYIGNDDRKQGMVSVEIASPYPNDKISSKTYKAFDPNDVNGILTYATQIAKKYKKELGE